MEEWADYISFLGKLNKALKSYTYPNIPRAEQIATRLAQCLDQNLPSGVHQKTLEVYNSVFDVVADQKDTLNIWVPGLLPLMSYASINVKPLLIDLFTTHILPMQSLRTILLPLIYALLPGIDDETNESFDAVFKLIDSIREKVHDDTHFWQCLFLVVISSSDRRLGALVWTNRKLPRFNSILSSTADPPTDKTSAFQALSYEAQTTIIPETGLLIRAFCKGLEDDQILVQRGFLELLVKNLELQSPALQFITTKEDLKLLLISACSTVMRRDVSLNRRLWNWLLGPEPDDATLSRADYFTNYGSDQLIAGLLDHINSDTSNLADRIKPYKLCHSIMDRWEIGSNVVPHVLLPIIKSVKDCESDTNFYSEVLRSASAFFDVVEAINIWSDCLKLLLEGTDSSLSLFLYIVQTFNVQEEEMLVQHLPLMLAAHLLVPKTSPIWLQILQTLIDNIPERAYLPIQHADITHTQASDNEFVLTRIKSYYSSSADDAALPFTPASLSLVLQSRFILLTIQFLNERSDLGAHFALFLSQILQKIPQEPNWRDDSLVAALSSLEGYNAPYQFVLNTTTLLITIMDGLTPRETDVFVQMVTAKLWETLTSESGVAEVEAVKSLWLLQAKLDDRRIEAALASLFVSKKFTPEDRGRALAALWNHSSERSNADVMLNRCIFLLTEYLQTPSSLEYLVAKHWIELVVANGSVNRLLKFITTPLLILPLHQRDHFEPEDDLGVFTYYSTIVHCVVKSHPSLKMVFVREFVPLDHGLSYLQQPNRDSTYSVIISHIILKFFSLEIPTTDSKEFFEAYSAALTISLELLEVLLRNSFSDILEVLDCLIKLLRQFNKRAANTNSYCVVRITGLLSRLLQGLSSKVPAQLQAGKSKSTSDGEHEEKDPLTVTLEMLSKNLVDCLIEGLSSHTDLYIVESWTHLLTECIPLFGDYILQVLMPLVECLCAQTNKSFNLIKESAPNMSFSVYFSYMKALEKLLAAAHRRVSSEDSKSNLTKPAQEAGFFGQVMSGIFSVESPMARSAAANNRLTVLLCFQDALKGCYNVWAYIEESQAKTDSQLNHNSRLLFWTLKVMESLYSMEALETLETFIEIGKTSPHVIKICHRLDGPKSKATIPNLLNSVASRVNPPSVNLSERSTMTSDLSDADVLGFLVEYLKSFSTDAIEDVWNDCVAFLKEVQNNHYMYRHLFPEVFRFIAVMAEKGESANFGDQRRVRRELADIFQRLFNISLSSKSITTATQDAIDTQSLSEKVASPSIESVNEYSTDDNAPSAKVQESLATSLKQVVPSLRVILHDQDKILSALSNIVSTLISPAVKAKSFPTSFSADLTALLMAVMNEPQSQKTWKTTVGDLILDQRFLKMPLPQAEKWKPIVAKWAQADKERLQDYTGRLLSHGSNSNVLFGWSEQESTYRRRNLNRLAYIFLSGNTDGYLLNIGTIVQKLEDVLAAETSITESVRAEVYTCLRAIVIKVDPSHLVSIWTFVYTELEKTFNEVLTKPVDQFKDGPLLKNLAAACKLLDTLLVAGLEDFKM